MPSNFEGRRQRGVEKCRLDQFDYDHTNHHAILKGFCMKLLTLALAAVLLAVPLAASAGCDENEARRMLPPVKPTVEPLVFSTWDNEVLTVSFDDGSPFVAILGEIQDSLPRWRLYLRDSQPIGRDPLLRVLCSSLQGKPGEVFRMLGKMRGVSFYIDREGRTAHFDVRLPPPMSDP